MGAATLSSPSPSPHTAFRATCSPSASPSPLRTCRRLIVSARRTTSPAPSTRPTTRSIHTPHQRYPHHRTWGAHFGRIWHSVPYFTLLTIRRYIFPFSLIHTG